MMNFKELSQKNHAYVVEMRRYFHMHPELSTKEVNTSKRICEELEKMDIPYKIFPDYNVIGIIDSGKPGKTVLIRGDIDALPVQEETGLEFASVVPGVMHACGHDAHAAMLLGIGKSLNEIKDQLTGKIFLGFQVAEENLKGSRTMVEAVKSMGGADNSIALHVTDEFDIGAVKLVSGPFASGVITYKITVKGQGGHGSVPHLSKDPIKPACDLLLRLSAIPSNAIDAQDPVVFSSCAINSGTAANIIPDEAVIMGTVRYFNKGLTQKIFDFLEKTSKLVCESYGVESEIDYMFDPMIPVENDDEITTMAQQIAKDMGLEVITKGKGMGSDDMALLLDAFPGFYGNIGCANPEKGIGHISNHNCKFTIDEDAMAYGTELLMRAAVELLNK